MDSPTQSVTFVRSNGGQRRVILIVVIVLVLIAIGLLAYVHFAKKPVPMTPQEQRAVVLSNIAEQSSSAVSIPTAQKEAVLNELAASGPAPVAPKKAGAKTATATTTPTAPTLTAAQKLAIINSLSQR